MEEVIYYCNQTNDGLALLTKIIADGGKPNFNRAEIGSGSPPSSEDIPHLKTLINKKHELQVKKSFIGSANTVKIGTILDSSQVTQGFEAKELGLFLLDDITGEEALFSYTYFTKGDYMPPGSLIKKTFEYTLDTAISSSANITIITPGEAYLTERDLLDHDLDPNAHQSMVEISEEDIPKQGCKIHYKVLAKLSEWLTPNYNSSIYLNPLQAILQKDDGSTKNASVLIDDSQLQSAFIVT